MQRQRDFVVGAEPRCAEESRTLEHILRMESTDFPIRGPLPLCKLMICLLFLLGWTRASGDGKTTLPLQHLPGVHDDSLNQ